MLRLRWQHKAAVMRACAEFLGGDRLYPLIQKIFGRLKANPMSRLLAAAEMAKWMVESGASATGKIFCEVGTGHVPVAPIGFFLCGAESVITVDLHRRIEWDLTVKSLKWIAGHRDDVFSVYRGVVDKGVFDKKFGVLYRYQHDPTLFFKEAGIQYLAPMDAAHIRLPQNSIDCHFSITVLEHIPQEVIKDIFLEAKRILKPEGVAVHFLDLSDHFQHTDSSISRINFLSFSDMEWQRIAGNQFAYCNRLRASDYLRVFEGLGFTIGRREMIVDPESVRILSKDKIALHSRFAAYTLEDLCSTSLRILLRQSPNKIEV